MQFQEIDIREIKENAIRLIRDEWALITAGDQKKWNTMTDRKSTRLNSSHSRKSRMPSSA